MGRKLGPTEWQLLGFVERYCNEHGMAPALTEIAQHIGLSIEPTWRRVQWLCEQEYLVTTPHTPRSTRPGPRLRR